MGVRFVERLGDAVLAGRSPACVGLDPRLDALPQGLAPGAPPPERIVAFYRETLPLLARHVPVVKPNIAFFEAFGAAGFAAYETTCRLARELGLLVVGDIKRGDIGSTAAAYAGLHLDLADAVTLQPYLGRDALEPFLLRCGEEGKAVFVLVATSNPGAAAIQDLRTPDGSVAEVVAGCVEAWGEGSCHAHGYASVGAVVGATRPDAIAALRRRMPHAWFLLPGVGAQGGRIDELEPAFDARGLGALVNQSRGVMQCFAPADADWRERIERAVLDFVDGLRRVSARPGGRS